MKSFAILGAHGALSCEEILSVTGHLPAATSSLFALYHEDFYEPTRLIDRLGGTQKLGTIIASCGYADATQDYFLPIMKQALLEKTSGKAIFGKSTYGSSLAIKNFLPILEGIDMNLKELLRQEGRSARALVKKESVLSAATLLANHLPEKGCEFVFLLSEEKVYLGITSGVQNIDTWVLHDRGRPRTNAKQGMLPPKLARMMLNLTGANFETSTVLDCFCGSGTVLMEAGVLGARHVFGSDIEPMAIHDTKENLLWAKDALGIHPKVSLIASPAKNLSGHFPPNAIDTVVTEPYLGRPRRGNETREDLEATVAYLSTLYKESFSGIRSLVKTGARMVIASPVHYLGDEAFIIPLADILYECGFEELPFSQPLHYRHEGQFVGRDILRFTRRA